MTVSIIVSEIGNLATQQKFSMARVEFSLHSIKKRR